MIHFTILQRTREIGIRKVNGAKSIEITTTLNKVFLVLVDISDIITTPNDWFAMHK